MKKSALLRVATLSAVALLICGCGGSTGSSSGGGGGGGQSNPTVVTVTISGATPTAVATQIGTGSYSAASLTAGKLTLSVPSGTANFAVAFVCPAVTLHVGTGSEQETIQNVIEASTLDGDTLNGSCAETAASGSTGTLTGAVDASAIPGVSFLNIFAANSSAILSTYASSPVANFSFAAPTGSDRVEVVAFGSSGLGPTFSSAALAARSFASQTVPGALNTGEPVVLGPADAVSPQAITYANVPSGYGAATTNVSLVMGDAGGFTIADPVTNQYPGLPASALQSGDYYLFTSTLTKIGTPSTSASQVYVLTSSASGGPQTLTFPSPWAYAGPTPAAYPTFDFTGAGLSTSSNVFAGLVLGWVVSTAPAATYTALVQASGNYLDGSTMVAVPNLSGIPGFLPSPASGSGVSWAAQVIRGSNPLQPASATQSFTVASTDGVYVAP